MHKEYYEGILQLRNVNESVIDFVYGRIQSNQSISVSRVKKEKDGIDIYLSSQKYLQMLGKMLSDKFGGQLKISRRVHSTQRSNSRQLYRLTVLFRMPRFRKNDIITYRGRKLIVLNLGKKVFCKDTASNKKLILPYDKLV